MGTGSAVDEAQRRAQTTEERRVERDLEQEVAAQRLGVATAVPSSQQGKTVSYSASLQLQEQLGDIAQRYLHMRHAYADPGQPRHLALQGLELLADARAIDRTDVKLYRTAMKKIDKVLTMPELESQAAYARHERHASIGSAQFFLILTTGIMSYVVESWVPLFFGSAAGLVWNKINEIGNLFTRGNSETYKQAVEKHIKKQGGNLSVAIQAVLDTGDRLYTQLQAGPSSIKASYANRAQEIEQQRTALVEYFENQPGFFERVMNAGKE